jgi:hypothetical protein
MNRLVAYWLVLLLSLLPPVAAQPADGRRLFYIGLALFAESWSENDVVELADQLRNESNFMIVPMIASDLASQRYPIADDGTIATMVSRTVAQVRPGDVIFVNISTHGGPGELARKVGSHRATGMSSRALARALAPLAGHPTIRHFRYSGSLIGDLHAPKRIMRSWTPSDTLVVTCVRYSKRSVRRFRRWSGSSASRHHSRKCGSVPTLPIYTTRQSSEAGSVQLRRDSRGAPRSTVRKLRALLPRRKWHPASPRNERRQGSTATGD